MEPRIVEITDRFLLGMNVQTSMSESSKSLPKLWGGFKARVNEIKHIKNSDFYSVSVLPDDDSFSIDQWTANLSFEKWAAVEVGSIESIPEGMGELILPGGEYAVFIHRGPASTFRETFIHIFFRWLPSSIYERDNKPNFEILGANYRPDDPNAEEEVWVPIRQK